MIYRRIHFNITRALTTVNSKIFARIFFSGIALKTHCDVQKSQTWHDLPISVNDRVIDIANSRGFDFHEASHMRKLNYTKISEFTLTADLQS